ncbi:unnamed protein product [Blepharisma stoltei]|uniref:Uncharacterized protein n=1 Tax=Blepharisma stoltei TaxID=1481888 RepID=A0AAU9J7D2_9CILI|nr:unnamed protein product [Blepharisma stoltei]
MFHLDIPREQQGKPTFQIYGKNLPPILTAKIQQTSFQDSSINDMSIHAQNDQSSLIIAPVDGKLNRNQSEYSLASNTQMSGKYFDNEQHYSQNAESEDPKPKKSARVNFSTRKNVAETIKISPFKPKQAASPILKEIALKRSFSQQEKVRIIKPSSAGYFSSARKSSGYSQIYTSEESSKPSFILGSPGQVRKVAKKEWKTLSEPPSVYTLTEQNSRSIMTRSPGGNKTEQDMRSIWSRESYKTQSDFIQATNEDITDSENLPTDQLGAENNSKDATFITTVNNQNNINDIKSEPIFTDFSDNYSYKYTPQPSIYVKPLIKETNSLESYQKWYGVPQKVRFLINQDYVKSLKPCNFFEEHKELLPAMPNKKYRPPKLLLKGNAIKGGNMINKGVVKDGNHLIRVLSREGTPWVQYNLKPTHQIRQDPFCANYGELLKLDIAKSTGMETFGDLFKGASDTDFIFSQDGISEGSLGIGSKR